MDASALAELIPWSGLGLTGLLTLGVLMILTGKLIPKSTVDELRAERDARLSDLQGANQALAEANKVKDAQISELLETSRATTQLLEGLRDNTGGEP